MCGKYLLHLMFDLLELIMFQICINYIKIIIKQKEDRYENMQSMWSRKSLKEYISCTNYQTTTYRYIYKKCVNKEIREKTKKIKEELNQLKEKEDIIKRFNNLKLADRILKLLNEGYDVSWSGEV